MLPTSSRGCALRCRNPSHRVLTKVSSCVLPHPADPRSHMRPPPFFLPLRLSVVPLFPSPSFPLLSTEGAKALLSCAPGHGLSPTPQPPEHEFSCKPPASATHRCPLPNQLLILIPHPSAAHFLMSPPALHLFSRLSLPPDLRVPVYLSQ